MVIQKEILKEFRKIRSSYKFVNKFIYKGSVLSDMQLSG
jgi:hypothetical protein